MSGTTQVIQLQATKQAKPKNGFSRQNPGEQNEDDDGGGDNGELIATDTVTRIKAHMTNNFVIKESKTRCKPDLGPSQIEQQLLQQPQPTKRRLSHERELVELLASFSDKSSVLLTSEKLGESESCRSRNGQPPTIKRSIRESDELGEAISWDQFYAFPRLHVTSTNNNDQPGEQPLVLQPSLFHRNHMPPTIYFNTKLNDDSKPPIGLPASLQHIFKWKISSITPNTIRNCVLFMKFDIVRQSNNTDNYYIGAWCKHMPTIDFGALEEWRKVNHYPGSFHMGRKDKLWLRLRSAGKKFDLTEFHPRTFVLPKDYDELKEYWHSSPSNLFIMKPPASARGNGVKVINNISQIPETALRPQQPSAQQPDGSTTISKKSTMVVQQYISNPCLLENRQKFDLRIYVLVTSVDPLRVYVHDEGLVRFASSKYTNQEDGIIDQYMHLTNYFINKNNRDYQINNDCDSLDGCKWTLKRFWRYIDEHYEHVDSRILWEQIIDIIIKTIICCETPMTRLSRANCKNDYSSYELFGFDIILDQYFKPWILEVNITPSLKSESNLDTSVKHRVIKDMFNLVGYHLPRPPSDEPNPMAGYKDCKLFFDERWYKESLTKQDKIKHFKYRDGNRDVDDILSDLTQSDIRVLMLAEDELSRCGQFRRVLPSAKSSDYLKYFDKPRYYNLLLDAWERRFGASRSKGIKLLSNLFI